MIDWPQSLVREIARRRCVFFLGAGVSASASDGVGGRPNNWREFLEAACELVRRDEPKNSIQKLIAAGRYLLALQAISDESDRGDYHTFLETNFNNQRFQPGALHEIILQLDSRIVITTNFDKIYERYCLGTSQDGYKIIPYNSDDIGDALRSDTRLIIKAHGTIDEISKMVFTKSEYHAAKRDYPQFYNILRAIFLTHTCVFVGCSLDDPDVLLVLEEVRITASTQRPHYATVLAGQNDHYALKDWQMAYNIKALEYQPNHAGLIDDLRTLAEQVDALRATNQES
jgi:SIR2-like protein